MLDPAFLALRQAIATLHDAQRWACVAHDGRRDRVDEALEAPLDPCVEPAQLWLAVGWGLPTTMTFEVETPVLKESIVFVSGTAVSAVAAGFSLLELQADIDPVNPSRIRLAYARGPEAFLCVRQLDERDAPMICSGERSDDALHERCDESAITESAVRGDLDCDADVDYLDLAWLLAMWRTGPGPGDLDDSGQVDEADLAILLAAWTVTGD
jgi:hypothetical protein